MTMEELLSFIKSNSGAMARGNDEREIKMASIGLQQIRAAMLPAFLIELYGVCGGIVSGNSYIFGPVEFDITNKFPIPSIIQINNEISGNPNMRGKTIFGRNDLFWFGTDAFGNCFMMDNIGLNIMKKYDDPWRAIYDCIAGGKI